MKMILVEKEKKMLSLALCLKYFLFYIILRCSIVKNFRKCKHYFFQRPVISDTISVYSKNYVSGYIFGQINNYHSFIFVNIFLIVNIRKSYCILGFKRDATWNVVLFHDFCRKASVLKLTIFALFLRQIAKIKIVQCCP